MPDIRIRKDVKKTYVAKVFFPILLINLSGNPTIENPQVNRPNQ